MATHDDNFFSRWSRRKVQVRQGAQPAEPALPVALVPVAPAAQPVVPAPHAAGHGQAEPPRAVTPEVAPTESARVAAPSAAEPSPTMDDVALLDPASDFRRFVAPGVDSGVKNAALKKLFADPHFNVMDGLDTYIDDYGRPDPLPASWLRQMTQSAALGLFDDDEAAARPQPARRADEAVAAPAPTTEFEPPAGEPPWTAATSSLPTEVTTSDEDLDLRLQPHDAAGPEGAAGGAGADAGRQH